MSDKAVITCALNGVLTDPKQHNVPVTPEQIKVHRVGTLGTGTLSIEATYTVRVNLPGYPLDLDFHASTKNKGIY